MENLNSFGLVELSNEEMLAVDGGGWFDILVIAATIVLLLLGPPRQ